MNGINHTRHAKLKRFRVHDSIHNFVCMIQSTSSQIKPRQSHYSSDSTALLTPGTPAYQPEELEVFESDTPVVESIPHAGSSSEARPEVQEGMGSNSSVATIIAPEEPSPNEVKLHGKARRNQRAKLWRQKRAERREQEHHRTEAVRQAQPEELDIESNIQIVAPIPFNGPPLEDIPTTSSGQSRENRSHGRYRSPLRCEPTTSTGRGQFGTEQPNVQLKSPPRSPTPRSEWSDWSDASYWYPHRLRQQLHQERRQMPMVNVQQANQAPQMPNIPPQPEAPVVLSAFQRLLQEEGNDPNSPLNRMPPRHRVRLTRMNLEEIHDISGQIKDSMSLAYHQIMETINERIGRNDAMDFHYRNKRRQRRFEEYARHQRRSKRYTRCISSSPDWDNYRDPSRSPSPPKCSMQRPRENMRPIVCMITTCESTGTNQHTIPRVPYPRKLKDSLESYPISYGEEFQPFLQGQKPTCTYCQDSIHQKAECQYHLMQQSHPDVDLESYKGSFRTCRL